MLGHAVAPQAASARHRACGRAGSGLHRRTRRTTLARTSRRANSTRSAQSVLGAAARAHARHDTTRTHDTHARTHDTTRTHATHACTHDTHAARATRSTANGAHARTRARARNGRHRLRCTVESRRVL
jgi:hypothetical protein